MDGLFLLAASWIVTFDESCCSTGKNVIGASVSEAFDNTRVEIPLHEPNAWEFRQ